MYNVIICQILVIEVFETFLLSPLRYLIFFWTRYEYCCVLNDTFVDTFISNAITQRPSSVNTSFSNWLYLLIMSRTRFRVNPHSIVAWMSRNSLLKAGAKSELSFYELSGSGFESSCSHLNVKLGFFDWNGLFHICVILILLKMSIFLELCFGRNLNIYKVFSFNDFQNVAFVFKSFFC